MEALIGSLAVLESDLAGAPGVAVVGRVVSRGPELCARATGLVTAWEHSVAWIHGRWGPADVYWPATSKSVFVQCRRPEMMAVMAPDPKLALSAPSTLNLI